MFFRWGIAELGKRAGFVGMRGRRGSFVGMRGKKSLEASSGEGEILPWKRGGNSGFVGMRG